MDLEVPARPRLVTARGQVAIADEQDLAAFVLEREAENSRVGRSIRLPVEGDGQRQAILLRDPGPGSFLRRFERGRGQDKRDGQQCPQHGSTLLISGTVHCYFYDEEQRLRDSSTSQTSG